MVLALTLSASAWADDAPPPPPPLPLPSPAGPPPTSPPPLVGLPLSDAPTAAPVLAPSGPAFDVKPSTGKRSARLVTEETPYTGGVVPKDAHVVSKPSTPLIAAGAVIFGVPYIAFLGLWWKNVGQGLLAILAGVVLCVTIIGIPIGAYLIGIGLTLAGGPMLPVLGPLLMFPNSPSQTQGTKTLYYVDAAAQAVGIGVLLAGLFVRQQVLVTTKEVADGVTLEVLPGGAGGTPGLTLAGTF